ncbi:hypothetical protein ACI2L1_41615 [Streptomyces sp. NPDC019531]|uniref:hypothetical protein n=1 Tax=Streptomyces sp. NPDC019531 TaxID=3365062 RepID=UPI00384B633C
MNHGERNASREGTGHLTVGSSPTWKALKTVLMRIKTTIGVTSAGILAAVLMSAPAAHASPLNFQSCNKTSSQEFVQFPYRGEWSSTIIEPGKCWQTSLVGNTNEEAVGYRKVNGYWLAVATKYFNDSAGFTEFDF